MLNGAFELSKDSITARALKQIRHPLEHVPASFPTGRLWYAVYTMPQREMAVRHDLLAQGFETFLPMETSLRVRRGRKLKTKRPVFARYIFTAFDVNRDYRAIDATDGVEYILENTDVPVSIPAKVIEELRRLDSIGAFDKDKGPQIGEEFRVVDPASPFAELAGKVQSAGPRDRIKLLLKIMNRIVATEFSLAQLDRIT